MPPEDINIDEMKRIAKNWEITVDDTHFPKRAKERDRSATYLIEQLREGSIMDVVVNPQPSDFVQYVSSVIVKIPKSSTYHYRIPTYLKENNVLHLKTVYKSPNRFQDQVDS